jgi:hypothetical protein
MLSHALKEWAVICRGLAEGRQALLLRKGGIAEPDGTFRLEHRRFWLYPTYVHQQRGGIKTEAAALLDQVEADRPPVGIVRLTHFAEVAGCYQADNPTTAHAVDHLHLWSAATVDSRFAYRRPGLNILPVRVYRVTGSFDLAERAEYGGCRSWVDLGRDLPIERAVPVLSDEAFRDLLRMLAELLQPKRA